MPWAHYCYCLLLPSVITNEILLQYVDDTTVTCSGPIPEVVGLSLNYQLSLVHHWALEDEIELPEVFCYVV